MRSKMIEEIFEIAYTNIEEYAKKWKEKKIDIGDWIKKEVLLVKKEQFLAENNGWKTIKFELLLQLGPSILLSTDGILGVYSGTESKIDNIKYGVVKEFLDAVYDYLENLKEK